MESLNFTIGAVVAVVVGVLTLLYSAWPSRTAKGERPKSQIPSEGQVPIACGDLSHFYDGIDKRIGVVSLDFYEQMRKEHCEFVGCDVLFEPSNYIIKTCPRDEWLLITEGKGAEDDACMSVLTRDDMKKPVRRRVPARWWDHPSSNTIRHHDINDLKCRSEMVLKDLCEQCSDAKIHLRKEEVVAIMLFSGPMYAVYNAKLSNFPPKIKNDFEDAKFTTTIHAIISAIQKLSVKSPVQRLVFRGTGGRGHLPESFWKPQDDCLNVFGYTEFGVMSMTSDLEEAIKYSGVLSSDRPHPAVLAFAPGAVDRGAKASLRLLSMCSCNNFTRCNMCRSFRTRLSTLFLRCRTFSRSF
jgi:hypothetical protein